MKFVLRRFRAILVKEYRHILRAPRTLLLVTLAPAFLLLLLANVFSMEALRGRFALWDLDRSAHSRRYVAALTANGEFQLTGDVTDYDAVKAALRRGEADFVLIVPHGFGADLVAGRPAQLEAIFDATDAVRVPQLEGYLVARSTKFGERVLLAGRTVQGVPMELRAVRWYNPTLKSTVGMVPGLIPIVLSMPALAFALSLARERELGSFEGLIATPVQGAEYLFGKAVAYVTLGLVSALLAWLVAVLWFRVPFRGSFLLYTALSALYLAATIGLVTALSPLLKTQQVAFFVVLAFFFVPSFFNAGLVVPVLDEGLARIPSDILPASHFIFIARSIFVKGVGLPQFLRPVLFLALMSVAGMVVALVTFKKRLS